MAGFQEKRAVLSDALDTHTEEFLGTIMVYLRRFGGTGPPLQLRQHALEVLSETALTVLQPRLVHRFDPDIGVAAAWIKKIAFNKTMSLLKRERTRMTRERGVEEMRRGGKSGPSGGPEEARRRSDDAVLSDLAFSLGPGQSVKSEVDAILSSLSSSDHRILSLHYLEGYSGEEVAEKLGINPGAAYVRLSRARKRAKKAALSMA